MTFGGEARIYSGDDFLAISFHSSVFDLCDTH